MPSVREGGAATIEERAGGRGPRKDCVRSLSQGLPGRRTSASSTSSDVRTRNALPPPVACDAHRLLPSQPAKHLYGQTDQADVPCRVFTGQECTRSEEHTSELQSQSNLV